MHKFLCESVKGQLKPLTPSKQNLLKKIFKNYEDLNKKFIVTIEEVDKKVNENQISLYKAFIVKASHSYGCSYKEMEHILLRFHPIEIKGNSLDSLKPIENWNSKDLDTFINQASSLLAENGFQF